MFEPHIGQEVETEFGGKAKVIGIIGEGKQSTVYLVEYNSRKMALKWYDTNKIDNLDKFMKI